MRTQFEGFSGSENIAFTAHAIQRMRERGVSDGDVRFILRHGTRTPAADGCCRYTLYPSWFVRLDRSGAFGRLVDWSVIVDPEGRVVTVYPDDRDLDHCRGCEVV